VKSLLRLRQSLAVVAVIVVAACNTAQNVSPTIGAGSNSRLEPTRIIVNQGGRLTAAYSGTYSMFGDCSGTRMFTYKGNGNAKFLHSSSEQIKLTWYCGGPDATGSATLTSMQVPSDSITANVSSTDFKIPCETLHQKRTRFTMSFTVTGGTGRFRRASGSGTIVLSGLSRQCISYSYSDKWRGTLKFRRSVKAL
jgi:hypothetical protein